MRYMLQIYFNDAQQRMAQLPEAEREAVVQDYVAFFQRPEVKDGNQLQPPATATTIHVSNGTIERINSPFIADEPLGGYYLIEANDINAAIATAAHIPAARMGGAVEIRPVVER